MVDHFLRHSLGNVGQEKEDIRLGSIAVSVGEVHSLTHVIDPTELQSTMSCSSHVKFQCLFVPYEIVARRLLLLSTVTFTELADLTLANVIDHIHHGRVGYYGMDVDELTVIPNAAVVVRRLHLDRHQQQVMTDLTSRNKNRFQLLFRDLSPLHLIHRLTRVHSIAYVDESEHMRSRVRDAFLGALSVSFQFFASVADMMKSPTSFAVIIVRQLSDSNSIEKVRKHEASANCTVLAYCPKPRQVAAKVDAAFQSFTDMQELASHVIHALALYHSRSQLKSCRLNSF